jgi:copper chaperone CopZ
METTTFSVPSITCNVCSNKIQDGLKTLNGVENVAVDLKSKTVNVQYDQGQIEPQEIRKKVSTMGYEVVQ